MLTPKQEKFCVEFAKCGNASQAYVNAGYKSKTSGSLAATSSRLLKNANVQKRIAELTAEAKNKNIADIQEMQERLTAIIRMQTTEEVLMIEGCGDGVTEVVSKEKRPAIKDVVAAVDKLAKMQGAYLDRVSIEGNVPIVISGGDDLLE